MSGGKEAKKKGVKRSGAFAAAANVAQPPVRVIEEIMGKRFDSNNRPVVLVRWRGSDSWTWESPATLDHNALGKIADYEAKIHLQTSGQIILKDRSELNLSSNSSNDGSGAEGGPAKKAKKPKSNKGSKQQGTSVAAALSAAAAALVSRGATQSKAKRDRKSSSGSDSESGSSSRSRSTSSDSMSSNSSSVSYLIEIKKK